MINGHYAQPTTTTIFNTTNTTTTFDNRDSRERRDLYTTSAYPPIPQPQPQPQQQHPPASSPPTSASPFAFAPPPLSGISSSTSSFRPTLPNNMHGEQTSTQEYSYYSQRAQPPPPAPTGGGGNGTSSYPAYSGSHPMGYRSISTSETRAPPPAPLARIPTFSAVSQASGGIGSQPSPTATSPYYAPPRAPGQPYTSAQHSPRGANVYTTGGYYSTSPYGQPQAVEMPRSLSYPNSYGGGPYAGYLPTASTPTLVGHAGELPPLMRHGSANGMGMGQQPPNIGYSFANRLPLVDRPFKCDQCVQSFNRNHDLKRHKRIHLSVKPYGCEKCGKTFSRKDALRRHWMVRGCRGEEGATAPITPTYPLNGPPPALSPPTPPSATNGSNDHGGNNPSSSSSYSSQPMSFNHPGAPPPLNTLPPRQSSDQPSQIILTPNEIAQQQARQTGNGDNNDGSSGGLGDPVVIDPALSGMDGDRQNGLDSSSYFDVMRKGNVPDSATSSTFSRYGASPKEDMRHHPYRRALPSPSAHAAIGPDGKAVFSMPSFSQSSGHLLPPIGSEDMSKEGSTDSADPNASQWPRW